MEKNNLKSNQLNFFEVIAMSVAIMAPSFAMASNTSFVAKIASYSVALVFLLTMIVVAIVSIVFIKFNKHVSSAGSVYSFTSTALGKKAGIVSGWAMFLTYFMFAAGCSDAFGTLFQTFLQKAAGLNISWFPLTIICILLIWFFAYNDITLSTKVMLVTEGISILLLLILSFVIISRVGFAGNLSIKPLALNGNSLPVIGTAVVFGFLSFAGFEGSSSLGEESKNPKKYIPLAIITTVLIVGIFFVIVSYAVVSGYGATKEGVTALANADSPLTILSQKYIGGAFADIVTLFAAISAFACALGSASAASRVLYSMGSDSVIPDSFSKVNRHGSPSTAVHVTLILMLAVDVCLFKNEGMTNYGYLGTIGSLAILICYMLTTVGGIYYFKKNKLWGIKDVILPAIGFLALAYVFYSNVYPVPSFPNNLFPYIVLAVIVIGTVFSILYAGGREKAGGQEKMDSQEEVGSNG